MSDQITTITVAVTARNEAAAIADTLRSILDSARYAEERLPLRFRLVAILDDCADDTESIVRQFPAFEVLHSSGGLVEAQRRVANTTAFVVYSDADILVGLTALFAICRAMLASPALQVAYPRKTPMPPRRFTLLASALYCYNRVNGFQDARRYFNGKFFAIRDWRVPTKSELQPRIDQLPGDRFYHFEAGLQIDDIYLSRDLLRRYGDRAIQEIADGEISYRPPETFSGMYHTYRRMRREIERLNLLFPESIPAHQDRRLDLAALRAASTRDRFLWRWFHLWLRVCIVRYHFEKLFYRRLSFHPCPTWPAISETKRPYSSASAPPA